MTFEASQDADEGDVSANTDGFERLAQGARSAELEDNIGPAMTGDVLHRSTPRRGGAVIDEMVSPQGARAGELFI